MQEFFLSVTDTTIKLTSVWWSYPNKLLTSYCLISGISELSILHWWRICNAAPAFLGERWCVLLFDDWHFKAICKLCPKDNEYLRYVYLSKFFGLTSQMLCTVGQHHRSPQLLFGQRLKPYILRKPWSIGSDSHAALVSPCVPGTHRLKWKDELYWWKQWSLDL